MKYKVSVTFEVELNDEQMAALEKEGFTQDEIKKTILSEFKFALIEDCDIPDKNIKDITVEEVKG